MSVSKSTIDPVIVLITYLLTDYYNRYVINQIISSRRLSGPFRITTRRFLIIIGGVVTSSPFHRHISGFTGNWHQQQQWLLPRQAMKGILLEFVANLKQSRRHMPHSLSLLLFLESVLCESLDLSWEFFRYLVL